MPAKQQRFIPNIGGRVIWVDSRRAFFAPAIATRQAVCLYAETPHRLQKIGNNWRFPRPAHGRIAHANDGNAGINRLGRF
jgi:hypothetical protein